MCFFVLALCVNSRDDTGLLYYPQWCYPHPASPPPLSLEPVSLAGISATKLDVPCPSARPPVFSVRECKDMRQALCATGMRITGIFSQILFLIQWWLRMLSIAFSLSFFYQFYYGRRRVQSNVHTPTPCPHCCCLLHWMPLSGQGGRDGNSLRDLTCLVSLQLQYHTTPNHTV